MYEPNEFAGKLAIVTGAAKENGIGFAAALALANRGVDVRFSNSIL
jgi:NAD(P)-dependent dehydrogenase (short-subunit alcohol dehydrogenase family)